MSNDPIQSVLNTSGTYNFAPSMGETILYAFGLAGVKRTGLTQSHFEDSRMATNLIMGRWGSDGVNLWSVDLQSITLVQGQATYQVPSNTIVILDAYYSLTTGGASPIDRIMMPVSRTEYASYTTKQMQGSPSVFWFDRLLSPTVTLWPVPTSQTAVFKYYRLRQTQDSNLAGGLNVEIPWYFLEPYALALAYRMALIWNPERAPSLKAFADEAWMIASKQNTENVSIFVSPQLQGYYR